MVEPQIFGLLSNFSPVNSQGSYKLALIVNEEAIFVVALWSVIDCLFLEAEIDCDSSIEGLATFHKSESQEIINI